MLVIVLSQCFWSVLAQRLAYVLAQFVAQALQPLTPEAHQFASNVYTIAAEIVGPNDGIDEDGHQPPNLDVFSSRCCCCSDIPYHDIPNQPRPVTILS